MKRMNETKEKILLLFLGGIAFGCAYTPQKQKMVLNCIAREWKKFDKRELREGIRDLCRYQFLSKDKKAGFFNFGLTKKGRLRALNIQMDKLKNKKEKWDGKWRMIAFDIPEKYKRERDALRHKLRDIGFCELQKSIFITPLNCAKEMIAFMEFYELHKYVRFAVLEFLDNESTLKKVFKL